MRRANGPYGKPKKNGESFEHAAMMRRVNWYIISDVRCICEVKEKNMLQRLGLKKKRKHSAAQEVSTFLKPYSFEEVQWPIEGTKKRRIAGVQTSPPTYTSAEPVKQQANRDLAIRHLSKILQDKFHKGVLAQNTWGNGVIPGSKNRNIVIFNICGQMSSALIDQVLSQSFVVRDETYFYCNQFSLVFEIGLKLEKPVEYTVRSKPENKQTIGFGPVSANEIVQTKAFREWVTSQKFQPPPVDACVGFIHPNAYNALNYLLEIVYFLLVTADVIVTSSFYKQKQPFHTAIIQLAQNQILPVTTLEKIKNLNVGTTTVKALSIVFHKASNSMRLIVRVVVKT